MDTSCQLMHPLNTHHGFLSYLSSHFLVLLLWTLSLKNDLLVQVSLEGENAQPYKGCTNR